MQKKIKTTFKDNSITSAFKRRYGSPLIPASRKMLMNLFQKTQKADKKTGQQTKDGKVAKRSSANCKCVSKQKRCKCETMKKLQVLVRHQLQTRNATLVGLRCWHTCMCIRNLICTC
ncbi:unnamed protein product [Hermetia illucens]|uniref:Uncharacterized protein n=1 Tax=Hermetia illucens TaxID=343691 RepID=A0A7R8UGR5_HERIL|nr:unnamed protein product [Hermetia illucens]